MALERLVFRRSDLTNLAVRSYLRRERDATINVLVVESGSREAFEEIEVHEGVSRVLLITDVGVLGRRHGPGSCGLSAATGAGVALTRSRHVFFSHSDMVACRDGFLSFLRTKLVDGARLAGFTQRGVIPMPHPAATIGAA